MVEMFEKLCNPFMMFCSEWREATVLSLSVKCYYEPNVTAKKANLVIDLYDRVEI